MSTNPRVYYASLADYNAGRLHGEWIDADQDAEDIAEAVTAMLSRSREPIAEEWAIHDYEMGGFELSEYDSFTTVATLGKLLGSLGETEADALVAFYNNQPGYWRDNLDDLEDAFRESYAGTFDSAEDYAEDYADSVGLLDSMPEDLRCYFDFEAFARDMEYNGDIWTANATGGQVHIFHSN